jgi:biopolymer transport protein TolR
MAFGGPKAGSGAISDINVTPLVDVMLVLLIIFMVTATLIKPVSKQEREVDMTLPETQTERPPAPDPDQTLILNVSTALNVTLNEQPVHDCSHARTSQAPDRFESCFEAIQAAIAQDPRVAERNALYILADMEVPYGFVVGILHRIRVAGVQHVGMVTHPAFLSLGPPAGGQ